MIFDAAVIGGGASGMTTAIILARRGLKVIIFEKYEKLGRKLLATGNGKCNIMPAVLDLNKYNTAEIKPIFDKYGVKEITDYFEGIGLVFREEEGRIFPYSCQASSVQNAIRNEIAKLQINVVTSTVISNVRGKGPFSLFDESGNSWQADNVVLSGGSVAGFGQDSTGLLTYYHHTCYERYPSLAPMITDTQYIKGLKGVRVDAEVTLYIDGKIARKAKDEIIFKDNGISGSAIFDLSVTLARHGRFRGAELVIDFVPDISLEKLAEIIDARLKAGQELDCILHKEIINNIVKRAGKPRCELSYRIAELAKSYSVKITSMGSRELAQVMCGGLKLEEFDINTLQSKYQRGIYATGEALNVDGECGGYNLMWAWASAMTVGNSIK